MAYKIQIGAAQMAGDLKQEGALSASASDLSASYVRGTGMTIKGNGNDAISLETAGADVYAKHINVDGKSFLSASGDGGVFEMKDTTDTNSNTPVKMYVNGDTETLLLQTATAGTPAETLKISAGKLETGYVSIAGDCTMEGNLTVTGKLKILDDDNNNTAKFGDTTADTFRVADKIVVLASGSGDEGDGATIGFGRKHSSDAMGARIVYAKGNPGPSSNKKFTVYNGAVSATTKIAVSASHFYGDASDLLNMANSSPRVDFSLAQAATLRIHVKTAPTNIANNATLIIKIDNDGSGGVEDYTITFKNDAAVNAASDVVFSGSKTATVNVHTSQGDAKTKATLTEVLRQLLDHIDGGANKWQPAKKYKTTAADDSVKLVAAAIGADWDLGSDQTTGTVNNSNLFASRDVSLASDVLESGKCYQVISAGHTWKLPASPTAGDIIKLSFNNTLSQTNKVTIDANGGKIDGEDLLRVESPDASIELAYLGNVGIPAGTAKHWVLI